MTPQVLKQRLHEGPVVFGTLVVSPSPRWAEAIDGAGLDFVFIDTEHIALDREQLSWMCHGYARLGLPPLVRIPSPDPYAATMVLDGGAAGVIAPYVETVEQVEALRGAVKMRPIKGRKLDRLLKGAAAEPDLASYLTEGAEQRLLIINIESIDAIEALDALLEVPDIDAVLIGPHDLTCSLGIPECYDHPDFLEACKTIFSKARAAGVGAGIHFWGDPSQQAQFIELGANLLIHSADILLVKKHLTAELKAVREIAGIQPSRSADGKEINI
jgi:4-hydroxy-2-oxoheptanedioate aldolase